MRFKELFLVPSAVIMGNAAGLATSVLLSNSLSPFQYSQFTLSWSIALVIATGAYEILRVSIIRADIVDATTVPFVKIISIIYLYILVSIVILVTSIFSFSLGILREEYFLVGACLLVALSQGISDGRAAVFRAKLQNSDFAIFGMAKTTLVLGLIYLSTFISKTAYSALTAIAIAQIVVSLVYKKKNLNKIPKNLLCNYSDANKIFIFGFFAMTSTLILNISPVITKYAILLHYDKEISAGYLLAYDLNTKFLGAVGSIGTIFLLQRTIRAYDRGQKDAIEHHICMTAMGIAPIFFIIYEIQPYLIEYFVPINYRESYQAGLLMGLLALGLQTFRVIGMDAIFVITKKTSFAFISSFTQILSFAGILLAISTFGLAISFEKISGVMLIAACISMTISAWKIYSTIQSPVIFSNLIKVFLAILSMLIVNSLFQYFELSSKRYIGSAISLAFYLLCMVAINTKALKKLISNNSQ